MAQGLRNAQIADVDGKDDKGVFRAVKRRTKREVVITEHGRAVARLAPLEPGKRFPDLSQTRRRFKGREIALSQAVIDDRNGQM
jgi:hypothetical protein